MAFLKNQLVISPIVSTILNQLNFTFEKKSNKFHNIGTINLTLLHYHISNCQQYFVGIYSRGKAHVLRLSVPIQLLLNALENLDEVCIIINASKYTIKLVFKYQTGTISNIH